MKRPTLKEARSVANRAAAMAASPEERSAKARRAWEARGLSPIDWSRYPLRTARVGRRPCRVCGGEIAPGDRYRDAGKAGKAHAEECAR